METNIILKIREFFIRNIVILIFLPLLAFFFIFISYGNELHQYLIKNPGMFNLYELSTLKQTVSQSAIPTHIAWVAFDMVMYAYILFSVWLILFAYSCYYKLSRRRYSFSLVLIEFTVLALIYYFIVSPGLLTYIQILGWLAFLLVAVMITVYSLLYYRLKHEKE